MYLFLDAIEDAVLQFLEEAQSVDVFGGVQLVLLVDLVREGQLQLFNLLVYLLISSGASVLLLTVDHILKLVDASALLIGVLFELLLRSLKLLLLILIDLDTLLSTTVLESLLEISNLLLPLLLDLIVHAFLSLLEVV